MSRRGLKLAIPYICLFFLAFVLGLHFEKESALAFICAGMLSLPWLLLAAPFLFIFDSIPMTVSYGILALCGIANAAYLYHLGAEYERLLRNGESSDAM